MKSWQASYHLLCGVIWHYCDKTSSLSIQRSLRLQNGERNNMKKFGPLSAFFFLSSHPQLPEIKFEVSSNQLAAVTLSFASIEDPPFYLFFLELVKSLFGKEECRIGNKTRAPHPIDVEEYDICTSFLSQRVLLRELPPLGPAKSRRETNLVLFPFSIWYSEEIDVLFGKRRSNFHVPFYTAEKIVPFAVFKKTPEEVEILKGQQQN